MSKVSCVAAVKHRQVPLRMARAELLPWKTHSAIRTLIFLLCYAKMAHWEILYKGGIYVRKIE